MTIKSFSLLQILQVSNIWQNIIELAAFLRFCVPAAAFQNLVKIKVYIFQKLAIQMNIYSGAFLASQLYRFKLNIRMSKMATCLNRKWMHAKGQLISKCLFGVIISTKIAKKML